MSDQLEGGPYRDKAETGVPSLATVAAVVLATLVLGGWKHLREWYNEQ